MSRTDINIQQITKAEKLENDRDVKLERTCCSGTIYPTHFEPETHSYRTIPKYLLPSLSRKQKVTSRRPQDPRLKTGLLRNLKWNF